MDATSSQHRSPLDLAHLDSLRRLSQGEAQVPHPLTGDLPQFLPILRVGTPAVGIFFDIFIGQHHFESSTSMIEVQDILDQEPVSVKCGDEEFVDPLTYTLAHGDFLVRRRSRMSSHNYPSVRQAQ